MYSTAPSFHLPLLSSSLSVFFAFSPSLNHKGGETRKRRDPFVPFSILSSKICPPGQLNGKQIQRYRERGGDMDMDMDMDNLTK